MLQLYIFLFVLATPAFSHKQRLPSTHKRHYQVAHAYDSDYAFSERDGWQSVPISDLPYKYDVGTQQKLAASDPPVDALLDGSRRRRRSMAPRNCKAQPSPVDLAEASLPQTTSQPPPPPSSSPSPAAVAVQQQPQPHPTPQQLPAKPHTKPVDQPVKEQSKPSNDDDKKGSAISVVVDGALTELDDMHGEGDSEDVTITWYTGNDLKNPSCWPKINWAPSVRWYWLTHLELILTDCSFRTSPSLPPSHLRAGWRSLLASASLSVRHCLTTND